MKAYTVSLKSLLNKYEQGLIDENEIHSALSSLISLIDSADWKLRQILESVEGDLELIDFTCNFNDKRTKYLAELSKLKCYLNEIMQLD
jgi:hypothetical protein